MIKAFILSNLVEIHKGDFVHKTIATAKLAFSLSPMVYIFNGLNGWLNLNYEYVAFVFIAIFIDHLLGTWVHAFIKKDFSVKENIKGFFVKITLVIAVGVLTEGIYHIISTASMVSDYFITVAKLMVFIYPAGSALMNSSIITGGKFPPLGLLKIIRNFNKNLDLNQFKNKEDEDKQQGDSPDL